MRHNDKTQGVETPSRLIQAFQHLLAVALNGGQLIVTNVRVHCFQRFQTRQLGRKLLIGFATRRIDQHSGRFFGLARA